MAVFAFFFGVYLCIAVKGDDVRPNILIVLADDLGWDDVSFHGSRQIPTPNLDALAYDGIILSNYYVQPICTPTRSALLTGRHPIHTGLQVDTITGAAPYGLGLNETIIPQYLKSLGYKTHMVGKWHLGFYAKEYTPTYRGFDSHFGYLTGKEDYWDHTDREGGTDNPWGLDFWRNELPVKDAFGQYSTRLFTQEAEEIIDNHNTSEPLFMYFAHQGVHSANKWKPLEAPWEYYSRMGHIHDEDRRIYAAMVSAVDDSVGNITKALHRRGMLNNTIIIFSTDNGGPANGFDSNAASNAPLRGMKQTLWEGGVRGTGFIWSSKLHVTGIANDDMIQVIDWLPTVLSAAGYNMSELPRHIDGIDQWGQLVNRTSSKAIRTEMLHNIESASGEYALRINEWKLIYSAGGASSERHGWYPEPQLMHGPDHMNSGSTHIDHENNQVYIMRHIPKEDLQHIDQSQTLYFKGARENIVQEKAPKYMFESDLDDILKNIGRNGPKGSAYVVNCGPRPTNSSYVCDVSKAPCLFNIKHDPCEYKNRAHELPDFVNQMYTRMLMYNVTAVPPKNVPVDPKGYPKNNGGLWQPWITLK